MPYGGEVQNFFPNIMDLIVQKISSHFREFSLPFVRIQLPQSFYVQPYCLLACGIIFQISLADILLGTLYRPRLYSVLLEKKLLLRNL